MKSLRKILEKRIINFGPISISDFMIESNQNPKFGYYNTSFPFGKNGDFVTAPEVSQMFGELIGLWIVDCWKKMGEPKKFNIIELGPGTGVLMQDTLKTINLNQECKKACKKIYLLEISNKLKKFQKKNLSKNNSNFLNKIQWINNLEKVENSPFILIANEFFDTLPIQQIELTQNGLRERLVNFNNKKRFFYFTLSNHPTLLEKFLPNFSEKNIQIGQIYEIPLQMIRVLDEIFKKINKIKSFVLIIDYIKKKTYGSTLKSIRNHKIVNPLKHPGLADTSVHVDFSLIKKISKNFNLRYYGPQTQRNFLIKLGILERAKILNKNANLKQRKIINNGLDFLINESKMGKIFQIISISNCSLKTPDGF